MELLQKVEEFARVSHGDQQRKFEPGPYIIHLVRVKNICAEYTSDEAILSAALLHDVLEDTPVSQEEVEQFLVETGGVSFGKRTTELVIALTDVFIKSNYPQWNRRKRKQKETERLGNASADAQTIKYADILDNSQSIANAEDDFMRVYLFEARALLKAMDKGNPELRARTTETIEKYLESLKSNS